MAKGFFKGVAWGLCVSLSAMVLFSAAEYAPDQDGAIVSGQPAQLSPEESPSVAELSLREVAAPEPDTLAGLVSETLSPAAVPQAGAVSDMSGTQVPETDAISGVAQSAPSAPQVAYAETGSLQTPSSESGLSISTEPAQPVAPQAEPQATAFESTTETVAPIKEESSAGGEGGAENISVTTDIQGIDPAAAASEEVNLTSEPVLPEASISDTEIGGFDSSALAEIAGVAPEATEEVAGSETKEPDAETELAALAPPDAPAVSPPVDANAPDQPTQQPVKSEMPSALTPEAGAPETSDRGDLPAPTVAPDNTAEGESQSARVDAEQSIVSPRIIAETEDADIVAAPTISRETDPVTSPSDVVKPATPQVDISRVPQDATGTAPPPQAPTPEVAIDPSETVRVNRLPSLGENGAPEDVGVEETVTLPLEQLAPLPSPLQRYAADFENPDGKPLMGIILMDDGVDLEVSGVDSLALEQLPYPVSFAVDALLTDAADRMRAYRAAGFEVLATVDLPEGAQASDAEVNLSVALGALPEVVAVLDGARTGVQTTPEAGRQVAQILAQSGHGFVTQNRGLNTVQKLATRQGVPSVVVFRDFDGKDQSSTVIRRFLDQAAFRAGQEGEVVMLGRLREETLAALVLWALQDRASSVAVAPISAVLRAP